MQIRGIQIPNSQENNMKTLEENQLELVSGGMALSSLMPSGTTVEAFPGPVLTLPVPEGATPTGTAFPGPVLTLPVPEGATRVSPALSFFNG